MLLSSTIWKYSKNFKLNLLLDTYCWLMSLAKHVWTEETSIRSRTAKHLRQKKTSYSLLCYNGMNENKNGINNCGRIFCFVFLSTESFILFCCFSFESINKWIVCIYPFWDLRDHLHFHFHFHSLIQFNFSICPAIDVEFVIVLNTTFVIVYRLECLYTKCTANTITKHINSLNHEQMIQ